ncbi:MAG TPA: tetratricopeptide repeat protein [Caldimonas sp.]|jgi:cytochrome c-type biogenesis protein CcmH|nr:tetratricopeptide repeat protein [Caldimonas sp.]HEX2540618.1 tetratricopeptide repeat protein [Caldimonas sp.]
MSDAPLDEATVAARPSRRLIAGILAVVVGVAVAGYSRTGSPRLAGIGATPTSAAAAASAAGGQAGSDAAASEARQRSIEQIAAMVDSLAERMKSRPDDAEGWTMLARSYAVLGRFAESLPAYRRASELQPRNAGLLADHADAAAASQGTLANAETAQLLERALAIDPQQPKALALAGTLAYERGDFAAAAGHWQKIADAMPPGSETAKQVQAGIAEARQRASAAAAASVPAAPHALAATSAPAASARASTAAASPPVAAGAASATVSGTVSLAPALAASAAPDDTVFVFARAAEGGRMPLAILRARVADLPLSFTLDDSSAMSPTARLSGASSVVVAARISKSGNAMPQAGDLTGESAPIAPGTRGLSIRIDRVVGAR